MNYYNRLNNNLSKIKSLLQTDPIEAVEMAKAEIDIYEIYGYLTLDDVEKCAPIVVTLYDIVKEHGR